MNRRPVIAIDGPAASGKSSTARAVAQALGFIHLDSGALYRAMTRIALDHEGADAPGGTALVRAARAAPVAVVLEDGAMRVMVGGRDPGAALRTAAVDREVSRVAAMPAVRDFVNALLRAAAGRGGVVMDGRDIGTVVLPDADVKVFMVADAAARARRRLAEAGRPADAEALSAEAAALEKRDALDSARAHAPLAAAPDAVRLDTTEMGFADQVQWVVELARRAMQG